MATTAYPFDPNGTSSLNRVINEKHVLVSQNYRDYHYIIPDFAPFVLTNFTITITSPGGVTRNLTEGVDYYFSNKFRDASLACAKEVYGSISFLDTDTFGIVTISYNTIGGIWTLSLQEITRILAEEMRNPRSTSWEQITNLPARFPVVDHEWDLVDMTGSKELIASTDRIRDAIFQKGGGDITDHINNFENPHQTTKAQVGLGNVQNYAVATQLQAADATSNSLYMTPVRVLDTINATAKIWISNHTSDKNNPHATTSVQVGLGNVQNLPLAGQAEAESGASNLFYMTPQSTKQAITAIGLGALNTHIADKLNPHQTDKTQVGLANVQNYAVATQEEARSGTATDKYMTPQRTRQLVLEYVTVELGGHASQTNNPHQVTAAQVGLGNVQNFGIASATDAVAATSNVLYMTPIRTKQTVDALVTTPLNNHLVDISNPHGTTKAQVGLGSVQNYDMAGAADAQAGSSNLLYMTPLRTKQAIDTFAVAPLGTHTGNTSNPHQVTKAQVGLSNVENYAVATQEQVNTGVDAVYTTARTVKTYVDAAAVTPLNSHVNNTSNPHGTTKAQIGLGSVENYPMANNAEALEGIAINRYMSPVLVKTAITQMVGTSLTSHVNNTTNPHQVTAAQVGLGSVQNYPMANATEAIEGTATNLYMSPVLVNSVVNTVAVTPLNTHVNNTSNPHGTTASQLGLGNVQNFGVASIAEAVNGTAANLYMTPLLVKAVVDQVALAPLGAHITDNSNPHNTTKAQVGLGNVQNYVIANNAEAIEGSSNTLYMTPLLVKAAIDESVGEPLADHVDDIANPHATTKAQVGLSNVQNYALASTTEANEGTATDKYMTPALVKSAVTQFVGTTLTSHVNNTANPHQTTAAQVGLGNVQNFGVASNAEAINGVAVNLYMTPANVKAVIAQTVGTPITDHVNNTDNPHQTTATQVGLGKVQNFGVATTAEAVDGALANLYMTPVLVKAAIGQTVGATLTTHVNNTANPHNVTSTQVGLGNVANYSVATTTEAVDGNAINRYMTPATVKAAIAQTVTVELTNHTGNTSNPHSVTSTQVGLGNVQNYAIASLAEAQAGASNTVYMTALRVSDAITRLGGQLLSNHADLTNNPHQVTKTQVGLGNVGNFGIATDIEAQQGLSNALYMTPAKVSVAIAALATPLSHLSNTANPHSTTAAQVGAFTKQEIDTKLSSYLLRTDTWVSGQPREDFIAVVRNGKSADSNALGGVTLDGLLEQVAATSAITAFDIVNVLDPVAKPYHWINIGRIVSPDDSKLVSSNSPVLSHPDGYWFVAGGSELTADESASATVSSAGYLLHAVNTGDSSNLIINATRITAGQDTVAFAATIDADNVMNIWMRVAAGYSPIAATQLSGIGVSVVLSENISVDVEPDDITYATIASTGSGGGGDVSELTARVTALESIITGITVV